MATKAELEQDRDRLAGEVARLEVTQSLLEERLGGLGERLAATLAERDRLAAELADLGERHAALAGELGAVTRRQQAAAAFASEPLVEAYWVKSTPPEGAHIDSRVYHGRGAGVGRASLPGGREVDVHWLHGERVTLPRCDFEVLAEAGFVMDAAELAAARTSAVASGWR
jgi:hypothetical protein